ncbi:MAG: hypothetical protein JO194_02320 [Candidatus Eremiobacteraeota bacterium]|nr:hypothetical protein [Candidatus Eremiobacteraeota bacterium]
MWPSKYFDPCGGSLELVKKYLAGGPCVFVLGQGMVQANYGATNTTSNSQMFQSGQIVTSSSAGRSFYYPNTLLVFGVTPRSQISITLPSFQQTSSNTTSTIAGATDMAFGYKHEVYFQPRSAALVSMSLSYEAKTGSEVLTAPGPAYTVMPLASMPLGRGSPFGIAVTLPFVNAVTSTTPAGVQRGWSFTPQIIPTWRSPGGTLIGLFVQHNFSPNTTPVTLNFAQTLARQWLLTAQYGGQTLASDYTQPEAGIFTTTRSYPRSISVGFCYMVGRSERDNTPTR